MTSFNDFLNGNINEAKTSDMIIAKNSNKKSGDMMVDETGEETGEVILKSSKYFVTYFVKSTNQITITTMHSKGEMEKVTLGHDEISVLKKYL